MTRQIKLGAFLPGGGQHVAAWRHSDQPVDGATSFKFHKELALTAERGLFDAYFFSRRSHHFLWWWYGRRQCQSGDL